MDQSSFDRLARVLGTAGSRRAALGAAVGAAFAGTLGIAEARKQTRKGSNKQRKNGKKDQQAGVSAQAATCSNPGPSSNLNGCNFNNDDLSGADLSSSSMRETRFRGTNLCGADLSSSNLRDADFRGFATGNATNLTRANLGSSGCKGTRFNAETIFCRTRTCDGSISDRDCPGGIAEGICCTDADCGIGVSCDGGGCNPESLPGTPFGNTEPVADGGVRLIADADAATPFGGVRFDVGAGVEIGEITRLETVYDSEVAPGCRAGSPRFELGTSAGNLFVYLSPDNDCATGPNETPNLIGNDEDVYYDAAQIEAGTQRIRYSDARAILEERELRVTRIALVADGARAGNPQRVVVRPRVDLRRVPTQSA